MKLRDLLYNIVDVTFDIEIEGVTCNPKKVKEGYLFVCVSKESKKYVGDVKTSVIMADFVASCNSRIYIFHPNPQETYSKIISRFYQFKQPKCVAAVTGTNGKTSVVEFCRQIWQNAGYDSVSIGTLGTCINNKREANYNNLTTPDADDFYATLCDMSSKNIEHLVLEASSHGIDQYRIHGLGLTAAAFTNFSQDHLDYHKDISEYFRAKKRLFCEILPKEKTVILNASIDECYALLKIAEKRGNKVITYGKKGSNITLIKQVPAQDGQYLTIRVDNEVYDVFFPVLGQFQACNLMCAIGIAISSGLSYKKMCIDKLVSPPGRMEKVKPFVFVDYAHTPSALEQVLLSLKWHFSKRVILVFGCGGNRDQAKRAEMGKIAQMYAERVIVTNDNPRDENPTEIRRDILLHCSGALEIEDRKEAIEKGMDISYNQDMVLLIAGKGHERSQIVNGQTFKFSDVEVVKNCTLPY
ncbi:UDP-N-acetylmuramoyl-L-alanyl-D-glutamate--2,6-diaminopimelate ligase [Wolbachia endosymbiont of Dirofilaria (Dirofilaria) immitis]|uniref:UDP-N-acetylmuramoyl-L-alanyl-D-glutamate--2, 6-diaminopimelate ligase n=1 Tax=Wolbachia endosymbiont of Dirofilaria (Dirofilaria) immitis TaxID=1812115 RepID=UPI001589A788|nr:UDP-N-acetylmuramoyl-L-alanyl-D-glutamate--2,6-diaminopimelate ligase [Wolbachia endosymbiont of Dirofilaria (Dirofilaria) immitis]QKX02314.1 UDP-N-acetylmuramoyl-L-alanyl-D-glutamate--2,6-diaminopimelate ligase [Wolbachia endosymbiont of Dirofilaria (Dirofilaria) immitis]